MDLSFSPLVGHDELIALPADLAGLMTWVVARQAASETAARQAGVCYRRADPRLFAPVDGAFNGHVAAAILRWKGE